jgi:sugar O-acyltransferase (sialic acid O-acetyltransferase NeuD family)
MKNKVIIVGAFHEIIELAEESNFEIIGLIDNEKSCSYRNYKILCNDAGAQKLGKEYYSLPLIITPDQPKVRKRLYNYYKKIGFNFISLKSNNSKISKSSTIGTGTVIQSWVNISSEVNIGEFVKLNTNCNIMHNSSIGNFSTIAPNAVVLGNVKIGNLCYIGSNATILPNITICDSVVIGAGAVVTKNITESKVYIGIPAKLLF